MHLEAANGDVREAGRGFVDRADALECDPEFVLAPARSDILVGLGVDIGIDAQSNRRADVLRRGNAADVIQLGFALDVEGENALTQCVLDFLMRFADSRKSA